MLADYRSMKTEALVTRSVFRALWFLLCVYACTAAVHVGPEHTPYELLSLAPFAELIGLATLSFFLLVISSAAATYIQRRSLRLTEMLVSLDDHLKDIYVQARYRSELRLGWFSPIESLTRREDLLWLVALVTILCVQALIPLLTPFASY